MDYDFKKVEEKIKNFWEKEGIYDFDLKKKGTIYSIDTPPPTVSGKMHIGHAFSYSQQDFIARFRRMSLAGKGQVFYPFGTDDNGLPTEKLVERLKNVRSKDMTREEFIKLCLKTLKEITPDFIQDWKDIGVSSDFNILYSTIDENSRKISQQSFLDLFKAGRIYTKEFPSIWCPECQTAIAQAELEDKEIPSVFSTIRFSVDKKELLIATTRPELIGACGAIFVNPKDNRFKSLKGKKAKVPIFNFEVPIIFDDSADPEKGTGAMMVCSYGDKYDVDAFVRHKLTPKIIFDKKGRIISGKYQGMKIKEARKKILEDLKNEGLIESQKQITHMVNVHDKCGTEIEFLPTEQWFVKILDKKKELIAQGKKVNWKPEHMFKRYENWINGLEWDWIISRERHFGIPIPVWKCPECGEIILPKESELPIDPLQKKKSCPKCKVEAEPENKVLDTWATSSLTPQIASSLVKDKVEIPFSLRPNGHDIIRTWAFYTIVKSYLHENKLPWKDIAISGIVTLKGEKMSKSKGNTIDPKTVLDQYGADPLRFWAAGSKLGEDMDYQEKDLVTGKKFVNKLLNASNFVFMNLKDYKPKRPKKLEKIDELFLAKINWNSSNIKNYFLNYEYSKSKQEFEEIFWKDFCDNYLEIVKWRVYNGTKEQKESAFYTLYSSLLIILKLIAPIMPFITEEIYQTHFRKYEKIKSIHINAWPVPELNQKNLDSLHKYTFLIDVLSRVRKWKSQKQKPMNSEIIITLDKETQDNLKEFLEDLKKVINAREVKEGEFKVEFV